MASFVAAVMRHTHNSGTEFIERVRKRSRPFTLIITSGFEWSIKQPQLQACISATSHLSLVSCGPLIGSHSLFMTFVRLPAWSSFIIRHLISFILQDCLYSALCSNSSWSLRAIFMFLCTFSELWYIKYIDLKYKSKYVGSISLWNEFVCIGGWYGIGLCAQGFVLKIVLGDKLVNYKSKYFELVHCIVS